MKPRACPPAVRDYIVGLAAKRGGRLTPEELIDAARDPASPAHEHFVWDDTEAARKYRLVQAGTLMRSVRLVTTVHRKTFDTPVLVRDTARKPKEQGYVLVKTLHSERTNARELIRQEVERALSMLRRAKALSIVLDMEQDLDAAITSVSRVLGKL